MVEKKPQVLITKEGYLKLKEELKYREGALRKKLQDTLNQMRSQGDLKENDGYTMAVDDFQTNEERILTIKQNLENAVIVEKKKSNKVELGSHVTIECKGGLKRQYQIVGEDEINPLESKISYKSPLGSSLLGMKKGSKVTIDTPSGKMECEVVDIE
jgi:transcription elongation factor GreA